MHNITGNVNINRLIADLGKNFSNSVIYWDSDKNIKCIKIEIQPDYLFFDNLEKKLIENGFLILNIEPKINHTVLTLTTAEISRIALENILNKINLVSPNLVNIFQFDSEGLILNIGDYFSEISQISSNQFELKLDTLLNTSKNLSNQSALNITFNEIQNFLITLPSGLIKKVIVKNILNYFDYEENEALFNEFYRILFCGGKLYLEFTDSMFYFDYYQQKQVDKLSSMNDLQVIEKDNENKIKNKYNFYSNEIEINYLLKINKSNCYYTNELLKGYLDYIGFINFKPSVSVADYEPGKFKINILKPGLNEFAAKTKKVLIKITSEYWDNLFTASAYIREIHNKYNNWDLYLVSGEYNFFKNNIYLKYCSNKIPPEKFDHMILLDEDIFTELSDINYPLKNIDSKKGDVFFDDEDIKNAEKFLKQYGISIDDIFIIVDNFYIYDEVGLNQIVKNIKKNFPYMKDFKILNISCADVFYYQNTDKDFKTILQIFALSSFVVSGDIYIDIADELYIPCCDAKEKKYNYAKRKNKFHNFNKKHINLNRGDNSENLYKTNTEINSINLNNLTGLTYSINSNALKTVNIIDISIIIPVYNNIEYTKNCLNSIFKNHPLVNFEIIIADNGSNDGTKEYLEKLKKNIDGIAEVNNSGKFNIINIISNNENLGFAKACNQAAKIANGKYLLFLNNDTYVLKGAIDELFNTIEKAGDSCGIAGSLLLYPDKTVQHAGVVFDAGSRPYHNYKGGKLFEIKNINLKNGIYLRMYNTVTAACMIIRKELFYGVGLFDEIFINGYEDVDLCLKVRQKGLNIIFNPKSMLIHCEEKTQGRKKYEDENQYNLQNKWKFKFKRDDYIFSEIDNLKMFYDHKNFKILYLSVQNLEEADKEIDRLIVTKDYQGAIKLSNEILNVDRYNIKTFRKLMEIRGIMSKLNN
ncbi:MAG: glycosyltransferase family 2 protein [bacterium]